MNVLLVCHNDLGCNSGIHISNLAFWMKQCASDLDVAVAIPTGGDTNKPENHDYDCISYNAAFKYRFRNGLGADLVHSWTPRQRVSKVTRLLSGFHASPYIVHLEDNEHALTAAFLGMDIAEFLQLYKTEKLNAPIDQSLAEPSDMNDFLNGAAGVTVLTEKLFEFKPANVPGLEFWPAAEDSLFYPQAGKEKLRSQLGIPSTKKIIVYHGNVHPANAEEVASLYLAVAALNRRKIETVLLRLGKDHAPFLPEGLSQEIFPVISVPFQSRETLPSYLALANAFVQPGRTNAFNAYRFPSKLPEFFALGRPVILPATNIGLYVKDDEEGLLLRRGDALEITEKLSAVFSDQALTDKLSKGARAFYERSFSWELSASKLLSFYKTLIR